MKKTHDYPLILQQNIEDNLSRIQRDTTLKDRKDLTIFRVKNAKNTHGRACGDYRILSVGFSEEDLIRFNSLINLINKQYQKSLSSKGLPDTEDNFDEVFLRPLQRKLYTFCRSPVIKKILTKANAKKENIKKISSRS